MNCSKCSGTIPAGASFCTHCGHPVELAAHGSDERPKSPVPVKDEASPPSVSHRPAPEFAKPHSEAATSRGRVGARKLYHADVVFAFDCTSSMGPYIEGLKNSLLEFAKDLEANNIDAQLGLVEFRDLKISEPLRNYGFAKTIGEFRAWVASLKDEGGGDVPESALDAISEALKFSFRKDTVRILVLITDAPYHEPSESGQTMDDLCREIKTQKIVAYVIGPDIPGYIQLTDTMGGILFNIGRDTESFRRILTSLGRSISDTVPRMVGLRSAADVALARTRVL